jgi:hypothetical protein
MKKNEKSVPLHKTVHWRRLKGVLNHICSYECIDITEYNTEKIICYRASGIELIGKNVKTTTKSRNAYFCLL